MPDTAVSSRTHTLSVVLIVPDATRRRSLATGIAGSRPAVAINVVKEIGDYPTRDELNGILQLNCDVVIVDLDDDVEQAVFAIESICSRNAAITVMAYSGVSDATLIRRSMQAGAREFLIEPLLAETVREAFSRVSSRRTNQEKPPGKMLVFVSTKGGVGVTSLAANFAIALTKESGARVVVVDLDLQLGEIALGLGMTASFSAVDALRNAPRLDRDFLSTLLIRHDSGLSVLASPEDYNVIQEPLDEGTDKLFRILREEFDYVVVDTGTCQGRVQESLFAMADKLYLIAELTFPSLRNAHRLISYLSATDSGRKVEVVLNRFNSKNGEIDEESATKAMRRPVNWRIPNGYAAARAAQDSGIPLVMEASPITRVLLQMAKAACGKSVNVEKKAGKGFSFFGLKTLSEQAET